MSGERGQAIVELALVLPLLLVFALAVLEIGELGVARLALEHAAAEGARAGALTNDDLAIEATVAAAVTPLDPSRVLVSIDPAAGSPPRSAAPRGALVRVRLEYALPAPLGFLGLPRFTVSGTATRRIEWSP